MMTRKYSVSNSRVVAIAVVAVLGAAVGCDASSVTNLPRAKAGARCASPGAFARDATNVLQCSARRRWIVNMPIARAVLMIDAYNRSNTAGSLFAVRSPAQVTAGSSEAVQITVGVSNQNGTPLVNGRVVFTQRAESGVLPRTPLLPAATEVRTGPDGRATLSVSAPTTAGLAIIDATVPGTALSLMRSVQVRAAEPATVSAVGARRVTTALERTTDFTVRVTDRFANPVFRAPIDVYSNDGGELELVSRVGSSELEATNINGLYTVGIRASTVADLYTLVFVASETDVSTTFELDVLPGAPHSIQAVSMALSANRGTTFTSPLVAIVTDRFGNGVPGQSVVVVPQPTGAASAVASNSTGTTDMNGRFSTTMTANGSAGSYLVRITSGSFNSYITLTNL